MRLAARPGAAPAETDMTPMIDMTFQLIAFFMVVVNFSEANQDERIKLPASELAEPPNTPMETPVMVQLSLDPKTNRPTVIFGAEEVPVEGLKPLLLRERQILEARGDQSARNATIVIRADRALPTGKVQEVIKICQDLGFESFALRAKHEEPLGLDL